VSWGIDVLMIPVGGEYTIGPKEASQIVSKIEPFFVLPMHYALPGMAPDMASKLTTVDVFLKESGLPNETLPKFVLKKEDITDEQRTKIIVLEKK
jgi:L-ascorbate metabolism protein UlaG (beta-lactamase superfamily)